MIIRQFAFLLLLASCGYNNTTVPDAIPVSQTGSQQSELNFATVNAALFQPLCIRCHGASGGVTLTSYTSVMNALPRIQNAVNAGFMPPSGPVSQATKNLLNQWIAAGAPENATATGGAAAGGAGGTTGTSTNGSGGGECEDDNRLMNAGIVVDVGDGKVYDTEKEVLRSLHNGCDDQ